MIVRILKKMILKIVIMKRIIGRWRIMKTMRNLTVIIAVNSWIVGTRRRSIMIVMTTTMGSKIREVTVRRRRVERKKVRAGAEAGGSKGRQQAA